MDNKISFLDFIIISTGLFGNVITNITNALSSKIVDLCTSSVTIDKKNPMLFYCLKKYLNETITNNKHIVVVGDSDDIEYGVKNGLYRVFYKDKCFFINLAKSNIIIYGLGFQRDNLEEFCNSIKNYYCSAEKMVCVYIANIVNKCEIIWNNFTPIRPRNILMKPDMQDIYEDISKFINEQESYYVNKGIPYKKTYLIEGVPGTGKTSFVHKIAHDFSRPIYEIIFNMDGLTDHLIRQKFAAVPANSIIIFDEFKKQIENLKKNKKTCITSAGILQALDGTIPLNHGMITIIIVNSISSLDKKFRIPLLRPGRIDAKYSFNIKYSEFSPIESIDHISSPILRKNKSRSRKSLKAKTMKITKKDYSIKTRSQTRQTKNLSLQNITKGISKKIHHKSK